MGYTTYDVRFAAEIYLMSGGGKGSVRLSEAAKRCSMTLYGARRTAERLALEHLAVLERYGEISLSEEGRRVASVRLSNISSAKRLLRFVGMDDDEVAQSAADSLPDAFFRAFEEKLAHDGALELHSDTSDVQNSPKLLQLRPK